MPLPLSRSPSPTCWMRGLRVARIGRSSVRYEVGIFRAGENTAAAQGHFVHVFVDRTTRRPVDLPERMRTALTKLADGPRASLHRGGDAA